MRFLRDAKKRSFSPPLTPICRYVTEDKHERFRRMRRSSNLTRYEDERKEFSSYLLFLLNSVTMRIFTGFTHRDLRKNRGEYSWKMEEGKSGSRGSSSCSTVPSGEWLYSMELFARVGGRPIFTLREINARFTRCYSSRIYVFVGQLFRSTRLFPPAISFHPRNLEGYPSWMENNNRLDGKRNESSEFQSIDKRCWRIKSFLVIQAEERERGGIIKGIRMTRVFKI